MRPSLRCRARPLQAHMVDIFRNILDDPGSGEVGGTALVGISKPVIKAHGSSDDYAIKNAIRQAATFVSSGIIDDIVENIDHMRLEREEAG